MDKELNHPAMAEALFDALPHIAFFVKDIQGRYTHVNLGFLKRCGFHHKSEVVGKLPSEIFPTSLAQSYQEQDQQVLSSGVAFNDHLELHIYPDGKLGWCLTHKMPLRDAQKNIIGLCGTSRDLGLPDERNVAYQRIDAAVKWIHTHFEEPVSLSDLVKITHLSTAQIERYFEKIFQLSPKQYIIKVRLDAAIGLLKNSKKSITDIAMSCGYQDHSAFSRVFKSTVGLTPSEYRELYARATSESNE